jgi:phosphoglycolate phosphatase
MYRYAFFDLDGTLTDSSEGIINSIKYALEKNGYSIPDETELLKFIGPPLADFFAGYLNLPKDQVQDMIDTYREYFAVKGLFENRVYDGAESMLAKLKRAGVELVLATSKPEKFARQILEHFELDKYFEHVVGATLDGNLGRKSDIIKEALKDLKIKDHQQVIMIGDREYDISGANDSGLDSIGVLYGFGRCEELRQAGATQIAKSTEEVVKYVLGQDAN